MKIKLSSVYVEDQDKALEFYTNVLGFVKKQDVPVGAFRWLSVVSPDNPDGTELLLEPNDNPASKTFQKAMFEQGIPLTAFAVEDVELEYDRLKELGVRFHTEPTPMGSTKIAVFDDTSGNLIQLYQEVTRPDLSSRPFAAKVERVMAAPPRSLLETVRGEGRTRDGCTAARALPGLDDGTVRSLVRGARHGIDEVRGQHPIFLRVTF